MNLQESIRRILKEETNNLITVMRRVDEIECAAKTMLYIYETDTRSTCKYGIDRMWKNGYIRVAIHFKNKYFTDIMTASNEWGRICVFIEKYMEETGFKDRFIEIYNKKCNKIQESTNNYYLYENKNIGTFKTIDKTIREYIKQTLKLDKQINQYVSNTHIADVFKDVLIYSELENENPEVYHNVKEDPYDKLGPNVDPNDYDVMDDGRFVKKETYSVGINDKLIPEYFDLKRLKENPVEEIHRTYQKLRGKKDGVRNMIILGRIVLPREYTYQPYSKSYKIKIK